MLFDIEGMSARAPSRFDMKKLLNLNGHYIRAADDARLAALAAARMAGCRHRPADRGHAGAQGARQGHDELADGAAFLFKRRPLRWTPRRRPCSTTKPARCWGHSRPCCEETDWTTGRLEANLKAWRRSWGWPWASSRSRCAQRLTGQTTSPGIFDVLALLGRDESLARIDAQARS
jgi:glutamyl-tRNA synthetase